MWPEPMSPEPIWPAFLEFRPASTPSARRLSQFEPPDWSSFSCSPQKISWHSGNNAEGGDSGRRKSVVVVVFVLLLFPKIAGDLLTTTISGLGGQPEGVDRGPSAERTWRRQRWCSSRGETSQYGFRQRPLRSRYRQCPLAQVGDVIEAAARPPLDGRDVGIFPLAGQQSGTLETGNGSETGHGAMRRRIGLSNPKHAHETRIGELSVACPGPPALQSKVDTSYFEHEAIVQAPAGGIAAHRSRPSRWRAPWVRIDASGR